MMSGVGCEWTLYLVECREVSPNFEHIAEWRASRPSDSFLSRDTLRSDIYIASQ